MVARELCVAGCLFYELFTTSIQHSASALEAALKERFVALLPIPCRLTKPERGKIIDEKTWTDRPSVDHFVHTISEGWRLPPPVGGFRPSLGYLLRWGRLKGLIPVDQDSWLQHRLRLRNVIAHGHNMVVAPTFALATLQQTTLTLNQLYPHPETFVYDEQVRKEREEKLNQWWLEIADMHRSAGDIPDGDPDSDTDVDV
jgi:hypothetical protein